mmetsp:Transcript_1953/g.5166  ORF Transcript_1953/g.5166 Transcript_1953/m.5166 type:complete len:236 (-) Transcript_1953:294-1001(-)
MSISASLTCVFSMTRGSSLSRPSLASSTSHSRLAARFAGTLLSCRSTFIRMPASSTGRVSAVPLSTWTCARLSAKACLQARVRWSSGPKSRSFETTTSNHICSPVMSLISKRKSAYDCLKVNNMASSGFSSPAFRSFSASASASANRLSTSSVLPSCCALRLRAMFILSWQTKRASQTLSHDSSVVWNCSSASSYRPCNLSATPKFALAQSSWGSSACKVFSASTSTVRYLASAS